MRIEGGVATRLLHVEGSPVLTRAWQPAADRVVLRAEPVDPASVAAPCPASPLPSRPAGPAQLELALERVRFALGVDEDLGEFHRRFRGDPAARAACCAAVPTSVPTAGRGPGRRLPGRSSSS